MGQTVSVDVPHKLGAEEAERRVREGFGLVQEKLGDKLSSLHVIWGEGRADLTINAMGQTAHGTLEFLPAAVRVSLELPWFLAALGNKIVGKLAKKTEQVLQLPAPKP